MDFEPNWKFSCDWLGIGSGNNSGEDDGCVHGGHVNSLEDVGVLANNSLHEVEVGCTQGRPSIEDTSEIGAIFFLVCCPCLKGDVGHGAMDGDRDGWQ